MEAFSLNKNAVPPAVLLLQLLAEVLTRCEALFTASHPLNLRMKTMWRHHETLEEDPLFLPDPLAAYLVQASLLGVLSMHNGVLVPDLKGLSHKGETITLYWQNGIATKWTLGVIDAGFYEAKRDICKKVFANQFRAKAAIESTLLVQCAQRIQGYLSLLPEVGAGLKAIQSPATLQILVSRPVAKEQLFVLMSCLPVDQLNLLFMTLGNSLPEETPLKVKQRQTLNVSAIFRQPSQDAGFLIEKVMCYMDLYYAVDWPILQHITQSVTQRFIKDEIVAKPAIFEQVCKQAQGVTEMQVSPRQQIYGLLGRLLGAMG
jgi:hypothetical protein